jgi:hypothetical protein
MHASVAVVLTIFPALFAAALIFGSHIAAEALAPPRLLGRRIIAKVAAPLLFTGWIAWLVLLLFTSLCFGVIAPVFHAAAEPRWHLTTRKGGRGPAPAIVERAPWD